MLKGDSKRKNGLFNDGAVRFSILVGRTTMALAVLAVVVNVFYEPFVADTPVCERPAWLADVVFWLCGGSIGLTFSAAAFSVLLGMIWPRSHAAKWGLASIALFIVSVFVSIPFAMGREHFQTEPPAVEQLRMINTAEVTYLSSNGGNYGTFEDLVEAELLDSRFTNGQPSGYKYKVVLVSQASYIATATRAGSNCSIPWDFFSESDAVVKYSTDAAHAPRGMAGMTID